MEDLFKALGIFQQSVQNAAINQGIANATKAVDQINQSTLGALEKRQQQSQLANQLALQLTGVGANANQVQQAFTAVAPSAIKNANDAYQLAATSGDPQMMKLAKDMQSFEGANEKGLQDDRIKATSRENRLNRESQERMKRWEIALDTLKSRQSGEKISEADVAFQTNVAMGKDFIGQLKKAINNSGTWESSRGFWADKKDAALFDSIPYQLAVTMAKVVDPNSVAKEGEVEAAKKFLLDLGVFASKDKALAHLQHLEETLDKYSNQRTRAKGGNPNLMDLTGGQTGAQAPNLFPQNGITSSPFFKPFGQ